MQVRKVNRHSIFCRVSLRCRHLRALNLPMRPLLIVQIAGSASNCSRETLQRSRP